MPGSNREMESKYPGYQLFSIRNINNHLSLNTVRLALVCGDGLKHRQHVLAVLFYLNWLIVAKNPSIIISHNNHHSITLFPWFYPGMRGWFNMVQLKIVTPHVLPRYAGEVRW